MLDLGRAISHIHSVQLTVYNDESSPRYIHRDMSVYGDAVTNRFTAVNNPTGNVMTPLMSQRDLDPDVRALGQLVDVVSPPTAAFVVRLSANPIDAISLTIATANDITASVSLMNAALAPTQTLYFNADNWQQGVMLVARSVDDDNIISGLVNVSMALSDSSTAIYNNPRYGEVGAQTLLVDVIDDDQAAIILDDATTRLELTMAENASRSMLVRLDSQPLSEVSVNLSLATEPLFGLEAATLTLSGDSVQTSGNQQFLLFDSNNWHSNQTLQLTIVDDLDPYDGTARLMLSIRSVSADVYAEADSTATAIVLDDDPASIILAATTRPTRRQQR